MCLTIVAICAENRRLSPVDICSVPSISANCVAFVASAKRIPACCVVPSRVVAIAGLSSRTAGPFAGDWEHKDPYTLLNIFSRQRLV